MSNMTRTRVDSSWLWQMTAFICLTLAMAGQATAQGLSQADQATYFVENQGQWDAPFAFKASIGSAIYYVTTSGMTIDFRQYERQASAQSRDPRNDFLDRHEPELVSVRGHVLKMNFFNANPAPFIYGEDQLSHYSNYFLGRDSCNWRGHVPHYQRVVMQEVWSGIDVELVAQKEGVETVYLVAPFADPSLIQIGYEGLDAPLSVDADGSLLLQTSLGVVKEKAPWAYQKVERTRTEIGVRFQLLSDRCYGVTCAYFDNSRELIVDPLLVYSSFWGDADTDQVYDVVIDSLGSPIVAGTTLSTDFPTTPGAYEEEFAGGPAFITKFDPDGSSLVFSTYFSGGVNGRIGLLSGQDIVFDAVVAVQVGWPVAPEGLDSTWALSPGGVGIARLSADGSTLLASSRISGSGFDNRLSSSLSAEGVLWLSGYTDSQDFPITQDAFFAAPDDNTTLFLCAVDVVNSEMLLSTYFQFEGPGAGGLEVEAMPGSQAWVYGSCQEQVIPITEDALYDSYSGSCGGAYFMLVRLQPASIEYASYFGNQDSSSCDWIENIHSVASDSIIVAGKSYELPGFALPAGGYDTVPDTNSLFIVNIALPGTITSGTFVGGNCDPDWICVGLHDLKLTVTGSIVVTGITTSDDFPCTPDAFDSTHSPGEGASNYDAFLAQFSRDCSMLEFGTYLGGNSFDVPSAMAVNTSGELWLVGQSGSQDFPITPNALRGTIPDDFSMGFVTKIQLDPDNLSPRQPYWREVSLSIQAYPNPFNDAVTLSYRLFRPAGVTVRVFDLLGRQQQTLLIGRQSVGEHEYALSLSGVASGSYWVQLSTEYEWGWTKLNLVK